MRFSKFKKLMSGLKGTAKPDAAWKQANRGALLAEIRRSSVWQNAPVNPKWNFADFFAFSFFQLRALQPVAIASLALVVVLSGSFATASAAKASLPGDMFYSVKISLEKAQVGLALSEEKKAELEISFAAGRLREVVQIIEQKTTDAGSGSNTASEISTAMNHFNSGLNSVQKRLDRIENSPKSQEKAVDISNLVNEKTLDLEKDLLEIKEKLTPTDEGKDVPAKKVDPLAPGAASSTPAAIAPVGDAAVSSTPSTTPEAVLVESKSGAEKILSSEKDNAVLSSIDNALEEVDQANTRSLAVIVEKAVASGNEQAQKDAASKLQVKIEKIELNIEKTQAKLEKIEKITTTTATSTVPQVTSSSPTSASPAATGVAEGKQAAAEIVKELQINPRAAQDTITEAKKYLETGSPESLTQALKSMQETKSIIKDANQKIETAESLLLKPAKPLIEPSSQSGTGTKASQVLGEQIATSTAAITGSVIKGIIGQEIKPAEAGSVSNTPSQPKTVESADAKAPNN